MSHVASTNNRARRKRRRRQGNEDVAAAGDSSDDGREHSPDASDEDRLDSFWATPQIIDDDAALPEGAGDEEEETEEQHDTFHADIPFAAGTHDTAPPRSPSPTNSYAGLLSEGETLDDLSPEEQEEFLKQKRERARERERKRVEDLIAARQLRDQEEAEERRRAKEERVKAEEEKWKLTTEQLSLMRRTAQAVRSSPNADVLTMRILANHGSDPRFSFLRRGAKEQHWAKEWEALLRGEEVRLPTAQMEMEKGKGTLVAYESDSEDEEVAVEEKKEDGLDEEEVKPTDGEKKRATPVEAAAEKASAEPAVEPESAAATSETQPSAAESSSAVEASSTTAKRLLDEGESAETPEEVKARRLARARAWQQKRREELALEAEKEASQ